MVCRRDRDDAGAGRGRARRLPRGRADGPLDGSVGFIVYYGLQDPVIGWVTHEFHSVVFGFVFAGLASLLPTRYRHKVWPSVAVGVAWGFVLWVLAAGVVSPVWLRLVGIPARIPTLSVMLLLTHLVWGLVFGVLVPLGYRYLVPALARLSGTE